MCLHGRVICRSPLLYAIWHITHLVSQEGNRNVWYGYSETMKRGFLQILTSCFRKTNFITQKFSSHRNRKRVSKDNKEMSLHNNIFRNLSQHLKIEMAALYITRGAKISAPVCLLAYFQWILLPTYRNIHVHANHKIHVSTCIHGYAVVCLWLVSLSTSFRK